MSLLTGLVVLLGVAGPAAGHHILIDRPAALALWVDVVGREVGLGRDLHATILADEPIALPHEAVTVLERTAVRLDILKDADDQRNAEHGLGGMDHLVRPLDDISDPFLDEVERPSDARRADAVARVVKYIYPEHLVTAFIIARPAG